MDGKQCKLGASGLLIGPLALGGNVFGWTADEPTSFQILDAFAASGLNLIDTPDVYSKWAPGHQGGESKTIIGKWLKRSGSRAKVVIATKAGMEMGPNRKGLAKSYILRAAEDSLRRLQTDYIDLYQAHTDDPDTPLDETLEAFAQLVKQGKVKALGASHLQRREAFRSFANRRTARTPQLPKPCSRCTISMTAQITKQSWSPFARNTDWVRSPISPRPVGF